MTTKVTIYWPSHLTKETVRKIRKRFGIYGGVTINGETPAEIKDKDLPDFKKTEELGYIQARAYKPCLEHLLNFHKPCTGLKEQSTSAKTAKGRATYRRR